MTTNDCHGRSARADHATDTADRALEAVFVDLDNTLVDGLAVFHLGRALARAPHLGAGVRRPRNHDTPSAAGKEPRTASTA